MTIASAIVAKQQQVAAAYTACNNKGATIPQAQNMDNLATCIATIPGGTDNYADYISIENTIKGTSYVEATEIATACDDISMFLYATHNS